MIMWPKKEVNSKDWVHLPTVLLFNDMICLLIAIKMSEKMGSVTWVPQLMITMSYEWILG